MLRPNDIDEIKKAISNASSLAIVERLEAALETGKLEGIEDLVGPNSLDALWDDTKSKPVSDSVQAKRQVIEMPSRKTAREQIDDELAKRRFKEATFLSDIVCGKFISQSNSKIDAAENGWIESPLNDVGKKRIVGIECGTAVCLNDGVYERNVLVRIVVTDFLTDRILIDEDVLLPQGYEAVDLFPSLTGLETAPAESAVTSGAAVKMLFDFISRETVLVTNNSYKTAFALKLNHPKWLSVDSLFQVDLAAKRKLEGSFYIRTVLAPWQLIEAYLGEAAWDRLKVVSPREKMVEVSLGMIRLVKALARENPSALPKVIPPPRKANTMNISHIPPNWSEEEIRMVLPSAIVVDPIDFFLDTANNEWRGETQVSFKNGEDIHLAFSKLTACTDVFVGWEWTACGKLSEETLVSLGSKYGPVVGVRIQEKYLSSRTVLPGKEESRPFGFVSLAKYQDAVNMTRDPSVELNGVAFHVKMSKKPITAFKRIPLGEGQDYIEAFIM